MKIACIYHSIDLDGWMSAAIVKHHFNSVSKTDRVDFIGYNYGQPVPNLSKYDQIIMVDISFPKKIMHKLIPKVIWIDHHISAINDIEDHIGIAIPGMRNTKFAACELTWIYFFGNKNMPEIVRLLGRYDCFGHKGTPEEQKVLEFQYGARQAISDYEEAYRWLILATAEGPTNEGPRNDFYINQIHERGKFIYQYLCTEARQSYKNGFPIQFAFKIPNVPLINEGDQFHTYKFICINKERFNPINFGIDYHSEGYDGAACFHRISDGKWAFSLYNDNGKVDCSLIAKQYGGGGHKGAAGFIVDDKTLLQLFI